MRRIAVPTSVVLTAAFSVAYAASTVITSTADFNDFSVADNISVTGGDLSVANIDNFDTDTANWIRKPYDGGATWGMELQKDAAGSFWGDDTCLLRADNNFSDHTDVGGVSYRTGPFPTAGTYAQTIQDGSSITLPGGSDVSEIRFLTHGARRDDLSTNTNGADTAYTVTVGTDSGNNVFTVDILDASTTSRAGSGVGSAGGSWSSSAYGGFTSDSAEPDCLGDEGDEVVITLPPSTVVTSIDFDYPTAASPDATTEAYLGGPFAVVTDALEEDVEDNFTWRATYESATATADAVSAGANAIWYEVGWQASSISSETDVFLYVRCATDTNVNTNLDLAEMKDFDGGSTGDVWQGPFNLAEEASPLRFADCTGTHLQYAIEFYPEFDVAPVVEELEFFYNADADDDGYPEEVVAGHAQQDCDDTDPLANWSDGDGDGFNSCQTVNTDCDDTDFDIKPFAVVDGTHVGDGVDQDCDGAEECFVDGDIDGFGINSIVPEIGAPNLLCDTDGEAVAQPLGFDCEDGMPDVFPGNTLNAGDVGNGIDDDCEDGEECFQNQDGDGFGTTTIIDESNDADLTCEAANGEATNNTDCMDTGVGAETVYPGKIIGPDDIDDDLDNDCSNNGVGDECWVDQDGDGFGNDQGNYVDSPNDSCAQAGEATDATDCRDTGANASQVFPGAPIGAAQIDNNIDDNCSDGGAGDECWADADDDGFGADDGSFVDSADQDCLDNGEAEASNANDCLDSGHARAGEIYPGAPIDPNDIDDGLDGNCSNGGAGDECWADDDNDGFGNDDGIHVESSDSDCLDNGEAQASNANDCLDDSANSKAADVYPGAPIDASDIDDNIDSNCSNGGAGDECWADDDEDGFGNDDGIHVESADQDCLDLGEAELANANDCLDDSGNSKADSVYPGAPIDASDIDDNIDSNCSNGGAGDECWADADNDGFGNDDGIHVESSDTDCNDAGEAPLGDDQDCLDDPVNVKAADVYPGAPIEAADIDDDIDDNCSNGGAGDECWADADGDGFGNDDGVHVESSDKDCTDGGEAESSNDNDCLDSGNIKAPDVYPGAPIDASDIDDNIDSNCSAGGNGDECWTDADNDGFGNDDGDFVESADIDCTDPGEAELANNTDCLDTGDPKAPDVYPGAPIDVSDIDDNIDGNCSNGGAGDECWADADNDGFGNDDGDHVESSDKDCLDNGEAELANNTDCLDSGNPKAPDVYPGASIEASDIDDNIDSNCSAGGSGDECWTDADNDGFGNDDGNFVESADTDCNDVGEAVRANDTDCLDAGDPKAPNVYPGAPIDASDIDDDIDSNCSAGGAGDECWTDADNDGFGNDDGNFVESSDKDCDDVGEGDLANNTDCLDAGNAKAPQVYPGAPIDSSDIEDGIDSNCSAGGSGDECWTDADNDGFGNDQGLFVESPDTVCNAVGEATTSSDCLDSGNAKAPDVYPGAPIENTDIDDGIDSNCSNGGLGDECWEDDDEDGFGNDQGNFVEAADGDCNDLGEALSFNDCDDNRDDVYPGKTIVQSDIGNNRDNDCDGADRDECWYDGDRDNHGDESPALAVQDNGSLGCIASEQEALTADDCDDGDVDFNPSVDDTCSGFGGDGIDNNCDGAPFDDDSDGMSYAEEQLFNTDDCLLDSDGDGVDDIVEFTHDCGPNSTLSMRGDVQDTDGDGVIDGAEDLNADTDGDGIRNPCDPDDDGDGIPTSVELAFGNTDAAYDVSDSVPDYLDDDDDNDGIPTLNESGDFDTDGLDNYRDEDDDGDGLLTRYERSFLGQFADARDRDQDGFPNHLDLDSDDDGHDDDHEAAVGGEDFDNDGIPDFLDFDSDNDTVLDDQEFGDFDGQQLEDRVDTDDDNDGLSTAYENSFGVTNPDGGEPNWRDLDSDGDGFSDAHEDSVGGANADGTDLPDFLDTDSDNDSVPDAQEGPVGLDTDGSGGENRIDPDDDGDGVLTELEIPGWPTQSVPGDPTSFDTDGDGDPNYKDDDDDNDGILTEDEMPGVQEDINPDGDADPNYLDTDSDGDGYSDDVEGEGDFDSDGKRDFLDDDSDNDSVPDQFELNVDTDGTDGPNRIDADDDGDGIPTIDEHSDDGDLPHLADFDNDGDENYLDTDSDNDGWSDAREWTEYRPGAASTRDSDGDGDRDFLDLDSDNDTIPDEDELDTDTDGSGGDNRVDDDDDGDTVPTATEFPLGDSFTTSNGHVDDDCAGVPCVDYLDPDDDDDGIATSVEVAFGNTDGSYAVTDSAPDYLDRDDDNDGLFTKDEPYTCNGSVSNTDWDGDGLPDYRDEDDDNDGLLTQFELSFGIENGDGTGDCNHRDTDSDGDTFLDEHEGTANFDGTDEPDFLDTDSDNDSVPDATEAGPSRDTDGDGAEDRTDVDDDDDGIDTIDEAYNCNGTAPAGCAFDAADQMANDWDDDGIPNFRDTDDDGDDVPTRIEGGAVPLNTAQDTDGDAFPDFLDTDDDNDTIPTVDERDCGDASIAPHLVQTDGDGVPNYLDTDDDDDTIPTAEEQLHGGGDANGDGCVNAFELDSDHDGWPDMHEYQEVFNLDPSLGGGTRDFDQDGLWDFVDLDSDNDDVSDETELDPVGDSSYPGGVWDYGTNSWTDLPPNFDGDPLEDRLDIDDDGDGIPTHLERYRCSEGDNGSGLATTVFDDMVARIPDNGACVDRNNLNQSPARFDWDGDGMWNYLDADDDDDNVPTALEDYDYTYVAGLYDHDGDIYTPEVATPDPGPEMEAADDSPFDAYDLDGDGFNDKNDTDGDGAPDFLDVDDDGDGIATILEDWASPGEPWNTNANPHGDPDDILDIHLGTYGDNLPDFLDPDDDGDGLPTANEDLDADGDPRTDNSNPYDPASSFYDNACVDPLDVEIACFDETPDYLDVDDDGDGVPSWAEDVGDGGLSGYRYTPDIDGDQIPDGEEWINFLTIGDPNQDPHLVTIEDFVGIDVSTTCAGLSTDDLNGDGQPDALRGRVWFEPWDRDCDGLPNYRDTDDDGDGFDTDPRGVDNRVDQDCIQGLTIAVGDGIPNYLDIDSDGHTQVVAAGTHPNCLPGAGSCTQRTDREEGRGDMDSDGTIDAYDCDESGATGDSDGDLIPNYVEDELCALYETERYAIMEDEWAGPGSQRGDCGDVAFLNTPACGQSPDSDCDGVLDCEEANLPTGTGNPCDGTIDASVWATHVFPDSDNDGLPDIFDRDDDGDTLETPDELAWTCPTGTAAPSTLTFQVTNNIFDYYKWSCVDADGQPTGDELRFGANHPTDLNTDAPGAAPDPFPLVPDAIPDYLDTDDDGDERPTAEEGLGDQDGDGVVNYLDYYDFDGGSADPDLDGIPNLLESTLGLDPYSDDSDGDGIPDSVELGNPESATDTDGDGTIDALDLDDDNDGIPSDVEGMGDQDRDGIPNFRDEDSDNDGISDADELVDGMIEDSDCDGLADFLDDSDDSAIFCDDGGDTGTTTPIDEGCGGCSSSGPSGMLGFLGMAVLGLVRRRRR